MSSIDAAAEAARIAAAIAARRAAELAAKKAAEAAAKKAAEAAAKKAAEAAAKKAAEAAAKKAATVRAKKFGKDEQSTGAGAALKAKALKISGAADIAPQVVNDAQKFKATDLARSGGKDLTVKPASREGLARLGLSADDVKKFGDKVPQNLSDAADKLGKGDVKGAIKSIADEAANHPELVSKAIQFSARQLPDGFAKTVFSDPKFATEIAKKGPDAIKTALDDPFEAVKAAAGDKKLRDTAIDAAMSDEKFKGAVDKLGLTAAELKQAGDALPGVIDAAQKAADGKFKEAVVALADAAEAAPDLVQKGLKKLGASLPDGVAKAILTDDKALAELAKAGPDAIKTALTQGPEAAIRQFAGNKDLRDKLIDAAMTDKDFAAKVEKFGLETKDLKALGDGLPKFLDGVEKASKGDWQGAISDLTDAAAKAPDVLAKGIKAAAGNLPAGIAKTVLTDAAVAEKLAKAGPGAIKALVNGDVVEGLTKLGTDKGLRDAVLDAAMKDQDFSKKIEALGLTAKDLKSAGDAAVHLVKAGVALANKDGEAALTALADAAKSAPELVSKGLKAAASKLPEGLARTILTDPKVADQIARASPEALRALAKGDIQTALGAVAGNQALRGSVIDAAFKDKDFSDKMKKLGLDATDLKQGSAALPDVFKAVELVAKGDVPGALGALRDAAEKAPSLVEKAVVGLGKTLPPGVAKDLLTDANAVKALLSDPKLQSGVDKLLKGDVVGGLSDVLGSDNARDAVMNVVSKNADVKAALEKVGLTVVDLKQAGEAAPHVLDAMKKLAAGDWEGAVDSFKAASEAAPELLEKMGVAIFNKLPAKVKDGLSKINITEKDIREGAAALPDLIDAGQAAAEGKWKEAVSSVLAAGEKAPGLGEKLITNVGKALPEGLARNLLTDPAVAKSLASDPTLHEGINQLLDGKILEGAGTLLHNDEARDAVLKVVSEDPQVKKALETVGLKPSDLVEAGAAAPHVFDAAKALFASPPQWEKALDSLGQAAGAAPNLINKIGEGIYAKLPKSVQDKLGKIGLTPEDFKQIGAALPHVIDAAQAAAAGKFPEALKALGAAVGSAPDLVTKAVNTLARNLPDGLAKTILTDPDTVKSFLTDPNLKGAATKLLSGDIGGAIRDAAAVVTTDSPLLRNLAENIASDPKLSAKLKEIGIESADDIVQLGAAMGDVFNLVESLKTQNWGQAVKDLGAIAADIPDGMRTKLIDALGSKLNLKPEMRTLLSGVIDAMGDPEVRNAIGDAFQAFSTGNPVEWIKGLANAGEVIAKESPDLAIAFLDTLSHLPGSVGAFFGDHELNRQLVESGSLSHMFSAVEKLASGDVAGAIGEIGNAFGSLLSMGEKFEIGPIGWGPAKWGPKELPIGAEGLEAVGRLMKQFIAALPPKVKSFLEEKMAKLVANTGFKSIPVVGPIVGVVDSGIDLVNSIKDGEDGLTIALDAASLVVNGASIFPPFQAATTPLKAILAVGEAANETVKFVQDMGDFGEQFTGMA
ncbi:MAG: hypothetical protein DI536_05565 [Archangium gephyra]|uniref:Uncharacterized protein n=1 Tax=Archangium gephyra TaxID=48 RepID=A0A2W5TRT5_9BACT|nr:MAG: hypothetical protein DI536_05565 [Archangium gephyra]